MDVFVDTIETSFTIELGFWDTVLTIKQKIEKSQGIPVRRQVVFFKGKVLEDHFDIIQCQILQNSRLKLFLTPEDNPNQSNDQVPQTEQPSSSASSNPIEEFAKITQTWPLMVRSNNDQVLQTEEPQVALTSVNKFLSVQESPVMVEGRHEYQMLHQTEQSLVPSYAVGETTYGQDSSVMVRSSYDISQRLRAIEENLLQDDDFPPVMVGSSSNTNKVGRPLELDKGKEIIVIPDSPVKKKMKTSLMTIMVKPLLKESWSFPMEVNADNNVVELRKELDKMQERDDLYLPYEEGYVLVRNHVRLIEDRSFQDNNVADGDTVDITGGYITYQHDSSKS